LLAKEKKRERERKILWRSRVFIPGIQISIWICLQNGF
jgi:hypothetical protein